MSIAKNMKIEIIGNSLNTINIISSSLGLNWSRENANIENDISQYGFRYTYNGEDITIWFIERDGFLVTTNVVSRHINQISIDKCNDMIELFANQNIVGRINYSIN